MKATGNPFLIDEETLEEDDEIYASFVVDHATSPEQPVTWAPSEQDEVIVDKLLRETRYYRAQIAKLEAQEKAEIERVKAVTASATSRFRFSLARRERSLEAFHEATGRERRVSPCGVLKTKRGSEKVRFIAKDGEVTDDESRFKAGTNHDPRLVKAVVVAKKDEIAKILRGKGNITLTDEDKEIVRSLAVLDRGPSTFVIEVPK
jgi:hypothetical protein